jgi:UDP-N-acetylmuramoyl-L-alanyl-D-glutamate--2,6-diaminopimelate ligase
LIKKIDGVPGRMELVQNDLNADIIVDYAHTPDALEKVLTTLQAI